MKNFYKILLSLLIVITIVLGFAVSLNMPAGNWYQQFFPNIGNRQITDMTFLDSLTGYAVAPGSSDTSYILKTTNSGDSWQIIHRNFFAISCLQFLSLDTGYAGGGYLYKTINGGFNWTQINTPAVSVENIYILNRDTIWFVNSDGLVGGVYRTTDGGANWDRQLDLGSGNPDKIYMVNARRGFCGSITGLYITTNSGVNWNAVPGEQTFTDIAFVDTLTGWKAASEPDSIKKTTNGGVSWFKQLLPPEGGFFNLSRISQLSVINKDTLWGVGARAMLGFANARGLIYRSTDGGTTWGYQLPDTSIHIVRYLFIDFVNKSNGWCYHNTQGGIHTTNGGDTTWYIGLQQISSEVPNQYGLHQNYPNPFNPVTNFGFRIANFGLVTLKIFDITGRELTTLLNSQLKAGEYKTDWNASGFSSGIYFYSLLIDGSLIDTKKMILVK